MMPAAARVLILCVIIGWLSLTTTSVTAQSYEECFTNYTVLERAVIATDDNRYSIIKAFYSPETTMSAVYVTIMYVTSDNSMKETWVWTKTPIYLLQPASVFQYSALLFNHHSITNRITKLTVTLPATCCNGSLPVPCYEDDGNAHCNNKYLDVLTNELYLYAMNDGRNSRIILNDVPSTSMRNHMNCSPDNERAFYIFNLFSLTFPFMVWTVMIFIVKSCRPRIRSMFNSPFRRSGVNQNYAALILTGMVFATFVLICDVFTLVNTFNVNSELNELDHYEPVVVHNFTKYCVLFVFILDFLAFVISSSNILYLFCNTYCGSEFSCDNIFVYTLWGFFMLCCCKWLHYEWNDVNVPGNEPKKRLDYKRIPEDLDREIQDKENKQWLLLVSFLAPVVCIGTHSAPVIMAWSSDTDNASSMTMVFLLSFFYYFFGFRQLYILLASCPKIKNCAVGDNENECCVRYTIEKVSADLDNQEKNIQEFNFKVLFCEILFAPFLMGIQAFICLTYFFLPAPVSMVPLNIVNVFHLALIVGGGLIAYKVLTIHKPKTDVILEKLVYSYSNNRRNGDDGRPIANERNGDDGRPIANERNGDGGRPIANERNGDDGRPIADERNGDGGRPIANERGDVIDPASKFGEILGEALKRITEMGQP